MPSIAIIGTEACGKTVFVTTLAKRFMTPDEQGVFIEPRTRATAKYIDRVWRMLSDCDWPPANHQGELNELHWRFHASPEMSCDIRIIDCAGHDLRVLFSDEQVDNVESLPKPLQKVANYCRTADIVLFTVNINNFVEPDDHEQQLADEWAIKYAMDFLKKDNHGNHCCLLFTQADRYKHLEEEHGNWDRIAEKFLPHVHAAHLSNGKTPIFPVAAVANTTQKLIRNRPNLVPDINFRSEGLEPVVQWIAESTRFVLSRQAKEKEAEAVQLRQKRLQEEQAKRQEEQRQQAKDRELELEQQQAERERESKERWRRYSYAMPIAFGVFVLAMLLFYPTMWAVGRYFYPLTEVTDGMTQEQQFETVDVYEDQPIWVTESIYEKIKVPGWIWSSWKHEKTGERVVQKGTKKVKIGTKQVPTGQVITVKKTMINVVGIQPKAWFWVYIFPLLLSAIAACAAFIWKRNQYVPPVAT